MGHAGGVLVAGHLEGAVQLVLASVGHGRAAALFAQRASLAASSGWTLGASATRSSYRRWASRRPRVALSSSVLAASNWFVSAS